MSEKTIEVGLRAGLVIGWLLGVITVEIIILVWNHVRII